jgi:hypothetical protein
MMLTGALIKVIDLIQRPPVEFDTRLKTAIPWSVVGIAFFIVACRGFLFGRRERNRKIS